MLCGERKDVAEKKEKKKKEKKAAVTAEAKAAKKAAAAKEKEAAKAAKANAKEAAAKEEPGKADLFGSADTLLLGETQRRTHQGTGALSCGAAGAGPCSGRL